jgi:hypothetical protein
MIYTGFTSATGGLVYYRVKRKTKLFAELHCGIGTPLVSYAPRPMIMPAHVIALQSTAFLYAQKQNALVKPTAVVAKRHTLRHQDLQTR